MTRKLRYHPSDAVPTSAGGTANSSSSPAPISLSGGGSKATRNQAAATGQRLPAVIPTPGLQKGVAGGSHRPIDQTFKMNPVNGTMSLAIPIPVTEGRGGFGPKLELSYSSGSGNGSFGIGWQLTSSTVTRTTSKRIPLYDETDTFLLSGQDELVPLGDAEQRGNEFLVQSYQPRVLGEPMQIERWSRLDSPSDTHWRTINGSNVTCIFGLSQESRISYTDQAGRLCVFSWLLCSSYDSSGNLITYEYKGEDAQGLSTLPPEDESQERARSVATAGRAKYLKAIKYGNTVPNRDLANWTPHQYDGQYHFQVVLDYDDHDLDNPGVESDSSWAVRQDRFSTCSGGFEVRWLRLCRRVLMFHHFPNELSEKPCLVRSVSMQYQESPMSSFLSALTEQGHRLDPETNKIETQALPPYTFQYNMPTIISEAKVKQMNTTNLPNLPTPESSVWQWVDLLGEGAPGLLEQGQDGSWFFRKNSLAVDDTSGPCFEPPRTMSSHPSQTLGKSAYFEDVNQDGNLELVCLDDSSRLEGFYHQDNSEWLGYSNFSSIPSQSIVGTSFKQLDLTGDGLADFVAVEPLTQEVIWLENLGQRGFGPLRRTFNAARVPPLVSEDPTVHITFADMTGDGHADIVQISPSSIMYWQNLSHGRFSEPVLMRNPPKLDAHTFSSDRVRLVDINGSGNNDLIYLPPSGGLHIYLSQAGNGWSEPQILQSFPAVNQLSSVSTLDLFGKGTACLCWTGKVPGSSSVQSLFYVDLAPGQKPNCLASYKNGSGSRIKVSYKSSNWFYLQDERARLPWSTKIGFPVQCVSKVIVSDEVVGRVSTKIFSYHDGYYDAIDREFRGFGMVEVLESDMFNANTPTQFRQPPSLTKTWYHTGAMTAASSSLQRASSAALFGRYWSVDSMALDDRRDFCRAFKGIQLRQEILGQDGSPLAAYPYEITDTAHQVIQLSPRKGPLRPGTYRCVSREVLQTHSERRQGSKPRYSHQLILETNTYNDVLKTLKIAYGSVETAGVEGDDPVQRDTSLVYEENDFCQPVIDKGNGIFVKPMPCSNRKYRIVGTSCSSDDISSAFTKFASNACQLLMDIPEVPYSCQILVPPFLESRIKIEERRILYRDEKLTQQEPLPLGMFQAYSVMHSILDLVGGDEWLKELFKDKLLPGGKSLENFMIQYGYIKEKADNGTTLWWRPSLRTLYGPDGETELATARKSFFTPTIAQDPFANRSTVVMDDYNILPKSSIDSVKNITKVQMDYKSMSPVCVTDPNGNRVSYCHDLLGRTVAMARSGKTNETIGDNLNKTITLPSEAEKEAIFTSPSQEAALKLMGGASSYRLYCDVGFKNDTGNPTDIRPAAFIDFGRMVHDADGAAASDITISITFLDGDLLELQTTTLTDTAGDDLKWNVGEWNLRNSKGEPIRIFQPTVSDAHEFIPPCSNQSGATTVFHDPLGRAVGTLYPDHAYSKLTFGAWKTTNYDRGDTVLIQDPAKDEDLSFYIANLPIQDYCPSWHATALTQDAACKTAATNSEIYSDTPDLTYLDAEHRPVLQVKDSKIAKITTQIQYDVAGRLARSIDAKGRLVETVTADLLGRELLREGMDTGLTVSFFDCMDRPVIAVDGRHWMQRTVYDGIGRKTAIWISQDGESEVLAQTIVYGERVDNANSLNLRGKAIEIRDQSGIQQNKAFDFKGNCVESSTQLTIDYKTVIDWKTSPKLEMQVHTRRDVYDPMDKVIESEDAEGGVTRHGYGISGHLQTVSWKSNKQGDNNWEHYQSNIVYAADGQVKQILYGNGVLATFQYDPVTRAMTRKTLIRRSDKRAMEDIKYSYDVMLRLTRTSDAAQPTSFFNNVMVDATCSYTYDTLGRLATADGREDANAGRSRKGTLGIPSDGTRICRYSEEYTYDETDNIRLVKHHAGPQGQQWIRKYEYEEKSLVKEGELGNRLSYSTKSGKTEEWHYGDGVQTGFAGTLISGGGMKSMSWDPFNRLKSCSRQIKKDGGTPETTWYVYNSEGKRIRKVTERESSGSAEPRKLKDTLFFSNLHIYRCVNGDESGYHKDKRYHLIRGDEQKLVAIAEEDKTKQAGSLPLVRYHMSDKLELDQSGLVISYEEFAPFGSSCFSLRRSKQEAARKYRFAAYERDKETGFYYCNARYYAPWLGRWISTDPIGTKDGLNLFCYCGNDPVNYTDPTGTVGFGILGQAVLRGMTIAAQPTLRNVIRNNAISQMKPGLQVWQKPEFYKDLYKPDPSSLNTPITAQKMQDDLQQLKDKNAAMLKQVQAPLGPMSKEIMKELKEFTLKQYAGEMLKEAAIQGYKHAVGAAGTTVKAQIALNPAIPFPVKWYLNGKVDNMVKDLGDAGEKAFRKQFPAENEEAQQAAERHMQALTEFKEDPQKFMEKFAQEQIKDYVDKM
ncbi:hypothetical protein HDV63DRAFT_411354 [Trichoderma sp. SZMC 28014]